MNSSRAGEISLPARHWNCPFRCSCPERFRGTTRLQIESTFTAVIPSRADGEGPREGQKVTKVIPRLRD